jgi:hypothetical protein
MKNQKKNEVLNEIVEDPNKRAEIVSRMNKEREKISIYERDLLNKINLLDKELVKNTSPDNEIVYKDTVSFIKKCFDKIIEDYEVFSSSTAYVKEQLYLVLYNLSIMFYEYCSKMRSYNYSAHACKYLIWIISNMESNIVLSGVKYLNWKLKLYTELASCYEDNMAYKSAFKVINQSILKFNELKAIEEQQSSLPDYIKSVLDEASIVLKTLEMKYGLLVRLINLER